MFLLKASEWPIIAGLAALVSAGALAAWFLFRRRPTPEEIERQRRRFLVESGRLIDGMSADLLRVDGGNGRTLTMVLYTYRIGGVDYECTQDVTTLPGIDRIRIGFPCTVRYQPGNPQNSIVVAEGWSGLREGPALVPEIADAAPLNGGS